MIKVSVKQHDFEFQLGDLVYDVINGLSEPDLYNSDNDKDYQVHSDHNEAGV